MNPVPYTHSAYNLMHEGILALGRAERVGLKVDVDYCHKIERHLERLMAFNEKQFQKSDLARRWGHVFGTKVNFNSNQQLSQILFKHMKLDPVKETATGQPSTDEASLSVLGVPEVDMLLKMRHLEKVKNTYIGAFLREQVNGILHPFFNLHIPRTYRSSSDSPKRKLGLYKNAVNSGKLLIGQS